MAKKKAKKVKSEKKSQTIKIDYLKSNYFRVVHCDGIFGGITPQGLIHMDVWNERSPIPRQMVMEYVKGEGLGEEIREEREVRDADTVREVEVGMVFDEEMAEAMVGWLNSKIQKLKDIKKTSDDMKE